MAVLLCFPLLLLVLSFRQLVSTSWNRTEQHEKRFLVDGNTVTVSVNGDHAIHTLGDKFVSVTLDTYQVKNHLQHVPLSSSKLRTLSKALGKAYLRIGGTSADEVVFKDTIAHWETVTEHDVDTVYQFAQAVGWEMIYDLNIQFRHNGQWDSTNAEAFIRYCVGKGYHVNLELGNEPNVHKKTVIDPAQIGRAYVKLRHLMQSIHPFNQRLLIGPSVTSHFTLDYAKKFLSTGSTAVSAFSIHHYYNSGTNLHDNGYTDPTVLDGLKTVLDRARQALNEASHGTHALWLGESAETYGGNGIPDTFLSVFMWLDKLGIAAENGVQVVARQALNNFFDHDLNPVPRYWLTLLYKRLVAHKVLRLTNSEHNHKFRIYAHCAAEAGHEHGVVFYFVNLYNHDIKLSIPQYQSKSYHLYLMTPGGNGDIKSKTVKLNEQELHLHGDALPPIHPKPGNTWPITVKGHSFGFVVVVGVGAAACP